MANKIDPYDVEALEKAVNDSATRVSTIWVSYLVFGLYLVISAGNVSHRQLFLEDPIRLPILNIDLPLVGFFFLAPILFIVFHGYALIQVELLARTAAAYNTALEKRIHIGINRDLVRQRLANTLFAQIFAGSSNERNGSLGNILNLMAWITLAVAPVLILLTFELKFLPYHSYVASWTHRTLLAVDLIAIRWSWQGVLDAKRGLSWHWLLRRWDTSLAAVAFVFLLASIIPSFPGEFQARWTRYLDSDTDANSSIQSCVAVSPLHAIYPDFDRLSLPREDFVDDEKLSKIEANTKAKGQSPFEGERLRSFRDRDLQCGTFEETDLRRSDFAYANLTGASFRNAELQGTSFFNAKLIGANLIVAKLHQSTFANADLQYARMNSAKLHGAIFSSANMQNVAFDFAEAPGATFGEANLRAASLTYANLKATDFSGGMGEQPAQLQAVDLSNALLQGADLSGVKLQLSDFSSTELQGAKLNNAQLQGVDFKQSQLQYADLSKVAIWKASTAACHGSQVSAAQFDETVDNDLVYDETERKIIQKPKPATPASIATLLDSALDRLPKDQKDKLGNKWKTIFFNPWPKEIQDNWTACADKALPREEYRRKLGEYLTDLVCRIGPDQYFVARGVSDNWSYYVSSDDEPEDESNTIRFDRKIVSQILARRLFGPDKGACLAGDALSEDARLRLLQLLASN